MILGTSSESQYSIIPDAGGEGDHRFTLEVSAKKSSKHDKKEDKKKSIENISKSRAAEILDLPSEDDDDAFELSLVLFPFDGEDPAQAFHTVGGGNIYSESQGKEYGCTTGFTVTRTSDNKKGVTTAG